MGRIVKEHVVRRNEILVTAIRLVYTKGYEQMTIQDILGELQISKGAFYHYFESKQALLEAIIEHMLKEAEQLLLPIIDNPHLAVLEKLQRFFDTLARWKTSQKEFLLALLRVWYADDNAIVRQKLRAKGSKWFTPLLMAIINQGIQEGTLTTAYPDRISEVVLSLLMGLGDSLSEALLTYEPEHGSMTYIEQTVAAYTDALERVLGIPSGSLQIVDTETLKEWFISA
jgi:AcrR family transcriptional regulator